MFGAKGNDGEAAKRGDACIRTVGRAKSPPGFERIADRRNAAGCRRPEERPQDSGKKVGVLVRVDVRDAEAGVSDAADLGRGFRSDFFRPDAESEEVAHEGSEGRPEFAIAADQRRDLFRGKNRRSVHEENMTADFKCGVGLGGGDGVFEEGPRSHERGGGERVGLMELGD